MKIEEGKSYLDRRGNIVGPMRPSHAVDTSYPWSGEVDGAPREFTDYGRHSIAATSHPFDLIAEWRPEPTTARPAVIPDPMYGSLAGILQLAHDQAASGKGKVRHNGRGVSFDRQPIMEIGRMCGLGYPTGQAQKKTQEATGMVARGEPDRAVAELLGAINYLAAAILLIREL